MTRPLITLLTDFGSEDYYVGAVKGVILSIHPEAELVDACHHIARHDVRAAAFSLFGYYSTYPRKTIHLAVVDPGVGSARHAIIAETANYFFVGPDNGLFSYIYAFDQVVGVNAIENPRYLREPVSHTFHGRDIFAPAAAWLSRGVHREGFGPAIEQPVRFPITGASRVGPHHWKGEVIQVDRFGNCVLSLQSSEAGELREGFELRLGNFMITAHHLSYAAASPGQAFVYAGSAGFLEVALPNQSAAHELGIRPGCPFELTQRPAEQLNTSSSLD